MKINEVSIMEEIFGNQIITILQNFYGIGKGFDIYNIDKDLKNPSKRLDFVRFFIKEKEKYLNENRQFNCHVEVVKTRSGYKELLVGNKKPYRLNEWEGISIL